MKNQNRMRITMLVLAMAVVASLTAFTFRGGEGFEIYIGKTMVIQQFLPKDKDIKSIDLSSAQATDELNVTYNHCGQAGTNRTVSLRNNHQVVKEWKFNNVKPGASRAMNIPVKDVTGFQKNLKGKQLSLYYTSDQLKEGRVLANFTTGSIQARK